MRILHVLSQIQLTGAEVYALHLAEEQLRQGHDVQIISDDLHIPTKVRFEKWQIHKPSGFVHLKNILKLRQKLMTEEIQVIHCHSRASVRLAAQARRGLPIAQITTMHGRQHVSWSKKVVDLYGDRIIAICENVAEHLKTDFKMRPQKIVVLRNPFSIPKALPEKKLANNSITLTSIGRTTGPKGEQTSQLLSKVFPDLLAQIPELKIDIVGRPISALGEDTLAQIQKLQKQFPGRLQTIENLKRLHDYWPQGDVVIGAGRVAIESLLENKTVMALGEAQWEGLITPENWNRVIASNFGDIGYPEKSSPLDFALIKKELKQVLETHLQNKKSPPPSNELMQLVKEEFSSEEIMPQIQRLYESAWWQKQQPQMIPILMYHKVTAQEIDSPHKIFVTVENFEKHLQFFKTNSFTTLTFKDLADFRKGLRPLSEFPKKPLILTFDDGYQNNLELAVPLLKKYHSTAVFFLLSNLEMKTNSWDQDHMPLMNPHERQQLADSGFEIGSHGFSHQKITLMSATEAFNELKNSKSALENELNTRIHTYAFTYGDTNLRSAKLAQKAGYEYAVNTDQGGLHIEEDPFQVFRINIFPQDGPSQLRKKTSSWYRRYYYLKRGK